jgi:hypothetical protein
MTKIRTKSINCNKFIISFILQTKYTTTQCKKMHFFTIHYKKMLLPITWKKPYNFLAQKLLVHIAYAVRELKFLHS